jgi:hypothetical protein
LKLLAAQIILKVEVIMASSALNILSGIAAAAAGLAGEKVAKDGTVPGLDLAAIIQALLGKSGGAAGVLGSVASLAAKSGLLNSSNLGNLASLAGSLLSVGKTETASKTKGGIEGLAAAIVGNAGTGSALGSIAKLASTLAKSATDKKETTSLASELGKTLSSKFGVSLGGGTAVKALDSVLGSDVKGELFKAVLKGLA